TFHALPPGRLAPPRVPSRFEPCRGCPRYRSSPVCAGCAIKPLGRNPKGTCSLGQDFGRPETAGRPHIHKKRAENDLFSLQINPMGSPKGTKSLPPCFS